MAATLIGPVTASPGLPGGIYAALNLTSAQVLKTGPRILTRVLCIAAGAITLNDCATVGAAAATNQIYTATLAVGATAQLDWPCATGLVASAVSGTFSVSFS